MDFALVEWCNRFGRGGFLDALCLFICDVRFLVTLWLLLGLAAVVLDRARGRHVLLGVVLALVLHFAISEGLIKHAIMGHLVPLRVRPYLAHPSEIVPLGTLFHDSSFPSSHNASSAAAVSVLCNAYRKTWPLGVAFIASMAFARMHCGMHYPTDVLTGATLGLLYGAAAIRIEKAIVKRRTIASAKV